VAIIEREEDLLVVGEAANSVEAMESYRTFVPDVTLMDLQLPDRNGIETIVTLRRDFPDAKVIVLTTFEGDALVRRALKAGAMGYLLKSMIRKELVDAVRAVRAGKRYIPYEVAMGLAEHLREEELTMREIQVLKAVAGGKSNKMIASLLFISEETVKGHMKSIMYKLGASDRTHAVSLATIRGFLM
jgi:DNA-binding NarL/FixJ family response regulator